MGLLKCVKRRACDVFVGVAASLTTETVLFRGNVNKNFNNMGRPMMFAVLFTVSLSLLFIGVFYLLALCSSVFF